MAEETQKTIVRATSGTGDGSIGTAGFGTSGATNVIAVAWYWIVLAKLSHTYFTIVLGVLTADGFGIVHLAGPGDLWGHLSKALFVGLSALIVESIKLIVTFTGNFDRKYPQLFG